MLSTEISREAFKHSIYCEMDFMKLIFKIINNPSIGAPSDKCKVFDSSSAIIGRSQNSDWVLPDPDRFISSKHAEIMLRDNQFYLKDISSNGVINGLTDEAIGSNQELHITNGQTFLIGEYLIQAELEGVAGQSQPQATQSLASEHADWDNQMDDFWGNSTDPLDLLAPSQAPTSQSSFASNATNDTGPSLADSLERTPAFKQAMSFTSNTTAETEPDFMQAPQTNATPEMDSGIPENWDNTSFSFPEPVAAPKVEVSRTEVPRTEVPRAEVLAAQVQAEPSSNKALEGFDDDDDFFLGLAEDSFFSDPVPEVIPEAIPEATLEVAAEIISEAIPEPAAIIPAKKLDRPASTRPRKRQTEDSPSAVQNTSAVQQTSPATQKTNANLLEEAQLAFEQQGLDKNLLTEDVASQWLALMPTVMQGTLELLQARAAIKNEFRVSKTLLTTAENNPLKFSVNSADAIQSLFQQNRPGFLTSEPAFQQAFKDINQHQSALLHGVRVAMMDLLKQFDAESLEASFTDSNKSSGFLDKLNSSKSAQAKLWQQYKDLYKSEYKVDSDDSFQRIFGETFAQAYDEFSSNE